MRISWPHFIKIRITSSHNQNLIKTWPPAFEHTDFQRQKKYKHAFKKNNFIRQVHNFLCFLIFSLIIH